MRSKRQLIQTSLTISDVLLMYLSLLLSLIIRYGNFSFFNNRVFTNHIIFFSFIQLLWLVFLYFLDFYEIPPIKNLLDYFARLIVFVLLCFASGSIYFYLLPAAISPKTILFFDVLIIATLLTGSRILVSYFVRRAGFAERVILIGSTRELDIIGPDVLTANGYQIAGVYPTNHVWNPTFSKEEVLEMEPDLVVLGNDLYSNKDLADGIFSHLPLGLNYMNFTDFYEDLYRKFPIEFVNEMWLLRRLGQRIDISEYTKRMFDLVFSALGLLITILMFPFIALAIKLTSRGPIFYKQERVGAEGKLFRLYKFRTMRIDAEANGAQWAEKHDPRITTFGRFLRYTHIDESPQCFNILKGDISFVGPRPERPEFVKLLEKEVPFYDVRYFIRPGLTGWAQVNYDYGSSIDDAKEKLQYDLYYISHRSISLDIAILVNTIRQMF